MARGLDLAPMTGLVLAPFTTGLVLAPLAGLDLALFTGLLSAPLTWLISVPLDGLLISSSALTLGVAGRAGNFGLQLLFPSGLRLVIYLGKIKQLYVIC